MLISLYKHVGSIDFPEYKGLQIYMHEFDPNNPTMPEGCEDYISVISDMCTMAKIDKPVFVTIDEKIVKAGESQRRPDPHVDGCFMPQMGNWGHGGWSHDGGGGSWSHGGGWKHGCNALPFSRMPVIVASTVSGCKAWKGEFDAEPKNNGDLSHIAEILGEGELLLPNEAYMLSPDCIHESLVFEKDTKRQFVRLALPVGTWQ